MRFSFDELMALPLARTENLAKALAWLCGEEIQIGCRTRPACGKCQSCMNSKILSSRLRARCFGTEEFNDLLLLVNQRPVSRDFFEFFFKPSGEKASHADLKCGIARFLGYAMLCFGNVRFAFRKLHNLDQSQICSRLHPYFQCPGERARPFTARTATRDLPEGMTPDQTWFLGYISRKAIDQDFATFCAIQSLLGLRKEKDILKELSPEQRTLYRQAQDLLTGTDIEFDPPIDVRRSEKQIKGLQRSVVKARGNGWMNTTHYLAIDFMDVYVATSMRERWEYEDVSKTIRAIFRDPRLKRLRLRYFDPTQSHLDFRIDKGLVEGLMLKRAACTVYLVQETDTFGKDSELASTLAQGKPVIAYVPRIAISKQVRISKRRPLAYLQKRLSQLLSDGRIPPRFVPFVLDFLNDVSSFRPIFNFISEEEKKFIRTRGLLEKKNKACGVLAQAEADLFDTRAENLQRVHPLAVQVHLDSGVANGVLVVRNPKDCASLIYRLLTNSCDFDIKEDKREGATLLVERISGCPFRVLTRNSTITNSFWSYYLT